MIEFPRIPHVYVDFLNGIVAKIKVQVKISILNIEFNINSRRANQTHGQSSGIITSTSSSSFRHCIVAMGLQTNRSMVPAIPEKQQKNNKARDFSNNFSLIIFVDLSCTWRKSKEIVVLMVESLVFSLSLMT